MVQGDEQRWLEDGNYIFKEYLSLVTRSLLWSLANMQSARRNAWRADLVMQRFSGGHRTDSACVCKPSKTF